MRYGRSFDNDKFDSDFEKDVRFMKFWVILAGVISFLVSLGILVFLGWIIVMIMKYFNVV